MRIDVVTVPYRYDDLEEGLGAGPGALLHADLLGRLRRAGLDLAEPEAAHLDDADRADDRTAVNIGRLGARTAALVAADRARGGATLVLAGDDTAAVGVVAGVQRAQGADVALGLVWFDAHGDFNTPETSYSGILAGMPVAILAGLAGPLWREAAGLAAPIPTDRIVLAGLRDLDEKEADLLRSTAVRMVSAEEMRRGPALTDTVRRLAARCACLCLHVDLDLLDPRFVPSASTPSAGGLSVAEAAAAMRTVLETGKVATVCLTSLNPGAGARGQRSLASALELLVAALPAWQATPPG
ncbi:MAG TPA: arginase family protein [Thermomicrobiales bacterium]|nr:arginase family protein [Thermomicrobiales bacterium]